MNCADLLALSPLYFSGELNADQATAFATHLKTCPACAFEIDRQAEADARLRAGLLAQPIDTGAVDQHVRRHIAVHRGRRWLVTAASFVLAGVLGYRIFAQQTIPRACADAALDHRIEVIDGQRRPWISDQSAIEAVAEGQGLPGNAVSALAASGYRFERGKLCRLDGRAFLHLIFTDGAREVSLFLRQRDDGRATAVDFGQQHVAALHTDRVTLMVVTNESREAAAALSRFAASAL